MPPGDLFDSGGKRSEKRVCTDNPDFDDQGARTAP
jgi:hypothetical protein